MTTQRKRRETAADSRPKNRVTQERRRRRTIMHLARLRVQARDEIDRLIEFLDSTDAYVVSELEQDAAEPTEAEIRYRGGYDCKDTLEDDEPSLCGVHVSSLWIGASSYDLDTEADDGGRDADCEPSLGSVSSCSGWGASQTDWGKSFGLSDGEEECEDEGAQCDDEGACREDDEPSLGWTQNGAIGAQVGDDREEGGYAVRPQNRTVIDRPPVTVEATYRRFVHGVPENIKDVMRDRVSSPEVFLR